MFYFVYIHAFEEVVIVVDSASGINTTNLYIITKYVFTQMTKIVNSVEEKYIYAVQSQGQFDHNIIIIVSIICLQIS